MRTATRHRLANQLTWGGREGEGERERGRDVDKRVGGERERYGGREIRGVV